MAIALPSSPGAQGYQEEGEGEKDTMYDCSELADEVVMDDIMDHRGMTRASH